MEKPFVVSHKKFPNHTGEDTLTKNAVLKKILLCLNKTRLIKVT